MTARTIATLTKALLTEPAKTLPDGCTIHRTFYDTERYLVDFAPDFNSDGWQQFDTDQDAHYFGVWLNPRKLWTLTYAEGDWSLVVCPDVVHYNAQVRSAVEFYGEGMIAKAFDDDGTVTVYRQDRAEFLLPGGAHR